MATPSTSHSWPSCEKDTATALRTSRSCSVPASLASLAHQNDDDNCIDSQIDEFGNPSWKTASWDADEAVTLQHEENIVLGGETNIGVCDPKALLEAATELEKQAAELKAMAHHCRVAEQKRSADDAPASGPMMSGYAFVAVPAIVASYQQAPDVYAVPSEPESPMIPMAAHASRPYGGPNAGMTTLSWRNLPNNYTRDDLLELIDSHGFAGSYDFFYAPVDFISNALMGYAFVNLISHYEATRFIRHFHGFARWTSVSQKVSEALWSDALQGLEVHIERYRNSPLMHADVPDIFRPVLLRYGQRVPFPPPTRAIRAPRLMNRRPRA